MPTAAGVVHLRESDISRYAPESLPITAIATRLRAERALDPPTCSTVAASIIIKDWEGGGNYGACDVLERRNRPERSHSSAGCHPILTHSFESFNRPDPVVWESVTCVSDCRICRVT